jgi:hypothetical protein
MIEATPAALLRRGARLASHYFPRIPPLAPVYAVHGSRDRLMRPPPVAHCRLIAGAGHGLALTHADSVTAFLRECLDAAPPAKDRRGRGSARRFDAQSGSRVTGQ